MGGRRRTAGEWKEKNQKKGCDWWETRDCLQDIHNVSTNIWEVSTLGLFTLQLDTVDLRSARLVKGDSWKDEEDHARTAYKHTADYLQLLLLSSSAPAPCNRTLQRFYTPILATQKYQRI